MKNENPALEPIWKKAEKPSDLRAIDSTLAELERSWQERGRSVETEAMVFDIVIGGGCRRRAPAHGLADRAHHGPALGCPRRRAHAAPRHRGGAVVMRALLRPCAGDIGEPLRHVELEPLEAPATAPVEPTVPAAPERETVPA